METRMCFKFEHGLADIRQQPFSYRGVCVCVCGGGGGGGGGFLKKKCVNSLVDRKKKLDFAL